MISSTLTLYPHTDHQPLIFKLSLFKELQHNIYMYLKIKYVLYHLVPNYHKLQLCGGIIKTIMQYATFRYTFVGFCIS